MPPVKRKTEEPDAPRRSGRLSATPTATAAPTTKPAPTKTEAPKPKPAPKAAATEAKPKTGKLAVGDTLPSVTLKNEEDKEVNVSELTKATGIVLFAYPKANTPGCTTQACTFRDEYAEFKKKGYEIYGISADPPKSQMNWKTKNSFPYHLLCDPSHSLLSPLGASKNNKTGVTRSHWVIEKGGKLADINVGITPKDSPVKAMAFVSK